MQNRHHHVDGRLSGTVHRDRDTAAVVDDLNPAVLEHADIHLSGVPRHGFIDGVVDDLPHQVV